MKSVAPTSPRICNASSGIEVVGEGSNLAVDASRFDLSQAITYAKALNPTACFGTRKQVSH